MQQAKQFAHEPLQVPRGAHERRPRIRTASAVPSTAPREEHLSRWYLDSVTLTSAHFPLGPHAGSRLKVSNEISWSAAHGRLGRHRDARPKALIAIPAIRRKLQRLRTDWTACRRSMQLR